MKKIIAILLALGMSFSLCACSEELSKEEQNIGKTKGSLENSNDKSQSEEQGSNQDKIGSNLHFLTSDENPNCYTENGYYYLSGPEKLSDGSYGYQLMYMDFATAQEIYLCNNAGCTHNTPDCPAVFLEKDNFSIFTLAFTHKDGLYFLTKDGDMDGTLVQEIIMDDSVPIETESRSTVLWRANLDGTNREKIYTFDSSVTLEDSIWADDRGIYVITKKLSAEKTEEGTYTTSSERKLVYLNLETLEEKMICSLEFEEDYSWKVMGCYDGTIVMKGIDYGREVTSQELFDDDGYKELAENSEDVIATVDLDTGKLTEKYRISNKEEHSVITKDNILYLSYGKEGSIKGINLDSGEEKELCKLENCWLYKTLDDKLCCTAWDLANDPTYYYVDIHTGEISHSGLVNKFTGWSLEFLVELENDVLVIYDNKGIKNPDGSYELTWNQYGLISKSDLFNGVDNFRKIEMIKGGV